MLDAAKTLTLHIRLLLLITVFMI